jgi:cephalosporin hydroxylase
VAFNLFVAYDLMQPGQNYDQVRNAIRSLGPQAQLQYSLFYVHSSVGSEDAAAQIRRVMDVNDKLVVIEAAQAHVSVYAPTLINDINRVWDLP